MRPATLTLVVLLAVFASLSSATTIHVPGQQPTIAAGIAAASPGDTVEIACDDYYETDLVISSAITLKSATGAIGCVTIYGQLANRILHLYDADGAVVWGIYFHGGFSPDVGGAVKVDSCDVEFWNCSFYGSHANVEGGGLRYRKGNPGIYGCDFIGNTAGNSGAGLLLTGTGGSLTDCDFVNNMTQWGGGAAVYEGATTTFDNCRFNSNDALGGDSFGGGLYTWNGASPTVQNSYFLNNTSTGGGGGACSDDNCSASFVDCTFTGNSAVWGGGIYVYEPAGGSIVDCDFVANSADVGGGVALENSATLGVSSSIFDGNTATLVAGGLALENCSGGAGAVGCTFSDNDAPYGGGMAAEGCDISTIVGGCTFALNEATAGRGAGAGIALTGGTPTEIENSIIAFSRAGEAVFCEDGAVLTAETCVIFGNAGGDWTGCLSGQESAGHNAEVDPLFCDMGGAWFALCENSYCAHTNNPSGNQIGSMGPNCNPCDSPAETSSWGSIKALYR